MRRARVSAGFARIRRRNAWAAEPLSTLKAETSARSPPARDGPRRLGTSDGTFQGVLNSSVVAQFETTAHMVAIHQKALEIALAIANQMDANAPKPDRLGPCKAGSSRTARPNSKGSKPDCPRRTSEISLCAVFSLSDRRGSTSSKAAPREEANSYRCRSAR